MKLLKILRKNLYPLTIKYLSRATIVEGTLRVSGLPFRCLFVGNSPLAAYLLPKIYAGNYRIIKRSIWWLPSLRQRLLREKKAFDICLAVLHPRYDRSLSDLYDYKGQRSVCQKIDTSGTWENIRKKFHKNAKETERKIRKYGLTCKLSRSIEDCQLFYHRMLVPLITKKYGNTASIESYENVELFFRKGFLLLVMEGDLPIGAGLCLVEGDMLVLRRMGVLDGNKDHLKKGAQSAIYYFSIRYAFENGFKIFNTMNSRAFLNDGVYNHKREWGASIHKVIDEQNLVYFISLGRTNQLINFLTNSPAIVFGISKQELMGIKVAEGKIVHLNPDKL